MVVWDFWTITVWHHVFKFNIWHPSPPSEGLRCILPLPRMPRNRGKIDPSNSRNATIDAYLSRKNSILELQILNELHTVALSFHSAWDSDRCLLQKWFLEKGMVLDYPFLNQMCQNMSLNWKTKRRGRKGSCHLAGHKPTLDCPFFTSLWEEEKSLQFTDTFSYWLDIFFFLLKQRKTSQNCFSTPTIHPRNCRVELRGQKPWEAVGPR